MRIFKKIAQWFVGILVVLNIAIVATGHTYLYKGIANTYLKGRSGPDIDEYKIFANREVKVGEPQPIANGKDYNIKKIDVANIAQYETVAYLVIKDDSVRYEQYWDNYNDNSVSNSFSMGKSFTGLLVGCAIQDGYIKTLDEPVKNYLPEFNDKEDGSFTVTIRHLLTMSSGINFDEDYVNPFAYPAKAYYGDDIRELTLSYKAEETPGKVFKYLSGNSELLGMILEKATGKKLSDYMSERLWIPMGAKNTAFWCLDHEGGMEKAYCCFNSNARDFSRFGLLMLHHGNWKGKQLINEFYISDLMKPAVLKTQDGLINKEYGYHWWMMDYRGLHITYARGILGQYVIVIPEKNMVVVRLGHKRDKDKVGDHPKDLFVYIDKALEMYP